MNTIKRLCALSMMLFAAAMSGCTLADERSQPINPPTGEQPQGDRARVVSIIDGDTIDVELDGQTLRVRYIGINTPERDEACYSEARQANSAFVRDRTVILVRDTSDTDRYGRLLRYVYLDEVMVNEMLVSEGWAESVEYPPDTGYAAQFRDLEQMAARNNRGCHPTGIFNDGSTTR
ncbi:MAG: thermonuclease family protein [Anaerolineae bacterium]|nr:thermonuclease family protein [Anaerolineae bacterium]NUQ04170.1 thermonuclease family protein [Anaerolineae bacterium]